MRRAIKTNTVCFILIFIFPLLGYAVEIEYGLPDSLQDLRFWDNNGEFARQLVLENTPGLTDFGVMPESTQVNALGKYTMQIRLPSSGIPKLGGFSFGFPEGFGLSYITDVVYSDDYPEDDPQIRRVFVYGNSIAILFRLSDSPPPGTIVTFIISYIRNTTLAGQYRLGGLIFNKSLRVVAGPTVSDGFEIVPGEPAALAMVPDTAITLRAGEPFAFSALGIDRFGNETSDLDFDWALSEESDNIGQVSDGNFFAMHVGTGRVAASYGGMTIESGVITVIPGQIDRFEIPEFPLAVLSGEDFPSPVIVAAYDAFDNLKTDYIGSIAFTSTDASAQFFYDSTNNYTFTLDDSGKHSFDGNLFRLVTIGYQTITVTDGIHYGSSGSILVESGPIVSFDAVYHDGITAGEPFNISINNAVDQYGNPAAGMVEISLIQGGPSPDGREPILNNILISDGSGSANQYLFKAGEAILRASVEDLFKDIVTIVLPADLGGFGLEVQPTQFVGHRLLGPSIITAFDIFDNIKTDFNAGISPVYLEVDKGELSPAMLDNENDFTDGMADLSALNVIYYGPAGDIRLSAYADEITPSSSDLTFNKISFNLDSPLPDTIYLEGYYSFHLSVINDGDLTPSKSISYKHYFSSCLESCQRIWTFPAIEPGEIYGFTDLIETEGLSESGEDTLIIRTEAEYIFNEDTIRTEHQIAQIVQVFEPVSIEYLPNSLSQDSVLSPSTLDTLIIQFKLADTVDLVSPHLSPRLYINPTGPYWDRIGYKWILSDYEDGVFTTTLGGLSIRDYSKYLGASEGYKSLRVEAIILDEGRRIFTSPLEDFDSIFVAYPSSLAYVTNSLSPTTVFDAQPAYFEFDLSLDGSTTMKPDLFLSRFELIHDDGRLAGFLADSTILQPGTNRISTDGIYIPTSLLGEEIIPRLIFTGTEINAPRTDTILFGEERILVSDHTTIVPRIMITAAELLTVNAPYLNYGQEFTMTVRVDNPSEAQIDSVSLFIQSEDGSQTFAEVHNLIIPALSAIDTSFKLTAPDYSISSLIFKAVAAAPNTTILPPEDNTVAVTVQAPARIELFYRTENVYSGYVDFGQPFSIIAGIRNLGEADAGSGELSLITGGYDFGIPDSSSLVVPLDIPGQWDLTAPNDSIAADLVLKITGVPIDMNTGLPAEVETGSVVIPIKVEPASTELVGEGVITQTALVIPGTSPDLFRLAFWNNTGNPLNVVGLKSIIIHFTDKYGATISPDLILSLSESGFYSGDSLISTSELYNDRLRVIFDDYPLYPDQKDTVIFRARINDAIPARGFTLCLDSRDIKTVFISGPRINQTVPITGTEDAVFSIRANFVIVSSELEGSLTVKNNPFSPDVGPVDIGYVLNEESDVVVRIFTLLGEKVYERYYAAGCDGGKQGVNTIVWDGKNDEGKTVLNGVYLLTVE
jgi:hypothetical protein